MRMSNIISLTEARRRWFDIVEEAQETGNFFVLTKHGKPYAILMGAKEHEQLMNKLNKKK